MFRVFFRPSLRAQWLQLQPLVLEPEAATAVIELLMMGGKTPETRWAVNKRQDNKLENCCIWLVIYLNCTMMHGLTNLKFLTLIPNRTAFTCTFRHICDRHRVTRYGARGCPRNGVFELHPSGGQRYRSQRLLIRDRREYKDVIHFPFLAESFVFVVLTYLTLRLLMSYIYGAPILDVSRSHTTTQHSR